MENATGAMLDASGPRRSRGERHPRRHGRLASEHMLLARVKGESGRVWVVDERDMAGLQRRAAPFHGWEEEDKQHRVFVQRVAGGDIFDDDREHVRRSFELAQLPEIRDNPFIPLRLDRYGLAAVVQAVTSPAG